MLPCALVSLAMRSSGCIPNPSSTRTPPSVTLLPAREKTVRRNRARHKAQAPRLSSRGLRPDCPSAFVPGTAGAARCFPVGGGAWEFPLACRARVRERVFQPAPKLLANLNHAHHSAVDLNIYHGSTPPGRAIGRWRDGRWRSLLPSTRIELHQSFERVRRRVPLGTRGELHIQSPARTH